MVTWINESETLAKHTSCKRKYNFHGRKCNSNQKSNNNKCWCERKNKNTLCVWCEKDYIWKLVKCSCKNGKYVGRVIDDSLLPCDEVIDTAKIIPTNFNEK